MARNLGLFILVCLGFLICGQKSVKAGQCVCPGVRVVQEKGGDGTPLYWAFEAAVVKHAQTGEPPLVCYGRTVSNHSSLDVLNIGWRIANYGRRFIPGQADNSSCPMIEDNLAPVNANGPLNYGVSSDSYDTRVRPPSKGWAQKAEVHPMEYMPIRSVFGASQYRVQLAQARVTDFVPLRSSFDVNVSRDLFANILIYSYVSSADGKTLRLQYELENRGNTPVRILVNMPISETMTKDLPFTTGFELPAESIKEFRSTVETQISVQPATVLVSDPKTKQGIGIDFVGVYAPVDGKRQFSDQNLYNSLK
jgi:hypothetical protein